LNSRSDIPAPGRVLVVDDQENLCWVVSRLLSERGHVVRTALGGAQALRVASTFEFEVAIVDYRLPDTSGLALLAQLRAGRPALRAILMTSFGSAALRDEVRTGGLFAYFDKPFVNSQMVDAVEAALLAREPA
jgi:DNA-binding NtrC family response regulator